GGARRERHAAPPEPTPRGGGQAHRAHPARRGGAAARLGACGIGRDGDRAAAVCPNAAPGGPRPARRDRARASPPLARAPTDHPRRPGARPGVALPGRRHGEAGGPPGRGAGLDAGSPAGRRGDGLVPDRPGGRHQRRPARARRARADRARACAPGRSMFGRGRRRGVRCGRGAGARQRLRSRPPGYPGAARFRQREPADRLGPRPGHDRARRDSVGGVMMSTRVLLADDHRVVTQCLQTILEREGFSVVAAAADGREAVRLARELGPDVAVLDVSMPLLNGLDAAREIQKACPRTRTVLLTMHAEEPYVLQALEQGVQGYVLKSQAVTDLVRALEEVCRGAIYLSPGVSAAVVDAYRTKRDLRDPLTAREREVLQLVA